MPAYKKSNNPVVATLSGAIAGGVEATVVWPTEYVKTLVQLDRGTTNRKYKGLLDCARQQVRRDGFLGLYRGLAPTLAFSIPKAGIRFGGFQFFKNTLVTYDSFRTEKGTITMAGNLLCGMGAGALEAIFAVTPMDTLKVKLIDLNMGLADGAKHIVRTEGVTGLYAGLIPSILKQSSNQGIRFMIFNSVWRPMMQDKDGNLSVTKSLFGGMFSGCCSTFANNPFDMVKTRMQGIEAKEYKSTMDCFASVLRREGPLGFYKGVVPRLMRVVPGQGVIFASYETISKGVSSVTGLE